MARSSARAAGISGLGTERETRVLMVQRLSLQMAKLSALANVTQARYGTRSAPASGRTFQNATTVASNASHNKTMSTKAKAGLRRPKKSGDQSALMSNCTRKSDKAMS